jgi:hypothetical protein
MKSKVINLAVASVISISSLLVSITVSSVRSRAIEQTAIQDAGKKLCVRQELPKLKQNMPYSKAREMLLESGWQATFNQNLVYAERALAVDYFFSVQGYTEVVDCSNSGLGFCLFRFESAYGEILLITTANNGNSQESVFGWRIEQSETEK